MKIPYTSVMTRTTRIVVNRSTLAICARATCTSNPDCTAIGPSARDIARFSGYFQ